MRIEQKSPHACSQLAMAEASTSNSSESGSEFLPLQGWKASVWKVFGFEAREGEFVEADKRKRKEVTCVLCKKKFRYSGNTSNMRLHLQTSHPSEFAGLESEEGTNTCKRQHRDCQCTSVCWYSREQRSRGCLFLYNQFMPCFFSGKQEFYP